MKNYFFKLYLSFLICKLSVVSIVFIFTIFNIKAQEFPTHFPWITDTVYISGLAADGGNGSKKFPYNDWDDFSFTSKTAYLFKRGGTMDINSTKAIKVDSVYIGGYGSGDRPLFYGKGTNKHFYFCGTQQYIQGIDVMCQDTGTCFTFQGDSTKFLWADSIEMSHSWWGTNPGGYGKIILSNIHIHRIRVDGLYADSNDTLIIKNAYIHDINRWYDWIQNINSSGGDCIQGENNGYVVIDGCTLDHSDNPGKFALIQNGADTVNVFNSILYGYDSTAVVYAGSSNRGMHFENCKFIGSKYGIWNFGNMVVKNCVFKSNWIHCIKGPNGVICNSVFADNPGGRKYLETKYNSTTGEYYADTATSRGIALPFTGIPHAQIYNNIFYNIKQSMECFTKYIDSTVMVYNNDYYNDPNEFDDQPLSQVGNNIFTVEPKFDTSKGDTTDFYLSKESELIDAGFDLLSIGIELTSDINGNKRPNGSGYDIGAYEYYDEEETSKNQKQLEAHEVIVYPNPTCGELNIESKSDEIEQIMIYNLIGVRVFDSDLLNTNTFSKRLNYLNTGVYIINVVLSNGSVNSLKIVMK